jgi:hypothetical protein
LTTLRLFVIDLATRRIRIAGITVHPNADWMIQVGRNLLTWLTDRWRARGIFSSIATLSTVLHFGRCWHEWYSGDPVATALLNLNAYAKLDPRRA